MTNDAQKLGAVFSETQAEFDRLSSWVWDPLGQALVDLTAPSPGDRVLDACCGAGASAIPAARKVAPDGHVDAIDIAEPLLSLGMQYANQQGVTTVDFKAADANTWDADQPYDVVQSSYGVFFLPEMDISVRRLLGLLCSGGRFGLSAWWRPALHGFSAALMDTVTAFGADPAESPGARRVNTQAERIGTPETMRSWLESLGLTNIVVRPLRHTAALTPRSAWDLVLGTGFRRLLSRFDADTRTGLRDAFLTCLAERNITQVDLGTVIACGSRE